jgi:hypothetical protein
MANNFTTNPMRIDTAMANDYLTTIGASAGLQRPIKAPIINVENPTAGATITIQDGSAGNNTLFEMQFPTAGATVAGVPMTYQVDAIWRNFKIAALAAGSVVWIYRR